MYMIRHLTEEELALYVDAIELGVQDRLPAEILAHVEECLDCKVEVIESLEVIQMQEAYVKLESHPYFDGP